jgi:hypothetical protein
MNTFSSTNQAALHDWGDIPSGLGFVYGIYFFDGTLKIGQTEKPGQRFNDYANCAAGLGNGLVFVGAITNGHLSFERQLVRALRPICRNPRNPVCEWFYADLKVLEATVKFLELNYNSRSLPPIHFAALMSPQCDPSKVCWTIDGVAPKSYRAPLMKKFKRSL